MTSRKIAQVVVAQDHQHQQQQKGSRFKECSEDEKLDQDRDTDRGFVAWLQCAAGFCIFFNTWGLLNTFGAFQSYYALNTLRGSSDSSISWIGTVQSSLIMLGALYSGPLYSLGYLRSLMVAGSFCLVFGMFMTGLCTRYWQFLLAQGVLMGLGLGCLFVPTTGVLSVWFRRRRGLAMGIASSGSAIGGIIYPIVFNRLVGKIGFAWSTRVIAFIMLSLCILPVLGMRFRANETPADKSFVKKLFREADYLTMVAALFLGYMGLYIPYFYIQLYCLEKVIITGTLNIYLLAVINTGGFFGRLAIGQLADVIGPINAFILDGGACTILVFSWIQITSQSGVLAFCFLYGFFSAGIITLPATIIAVSLCPDIRQYAMRMTVPMVPIAIGLLIGNPIAGAVLEHGWVALQCFSGACILGCTVLSITTRALHSGLHWKANC